MFSFGAWFADPALPQPKPTAGMPSWSHTWAIGPDPAVTYAATAPLPEDIDEIVFAGFHHDADTVIEEKLKANTSPRRVTVVSSDRRLRRAAALRKAAGVKSEEFWEQVRKELARKTPRRREPEEKREGLSESETDRWLETFGLDK